MFDDLPLSIPLKTFNLPVLIFLMLNLSAQGKSDALAEGLNVVENIFYSGMEEGVSCYRIPALVTAPNGDLVAAIDQRVPSCGDLKWSDDINIIIRRSTDDGKTWSDIEAIVDHPPGMSASDPSMIVDQQTNEIFLFYNYMDLINEKDIYYLHVIMSSDNGNTWSTPLDITPQISKPGWKSDFKFITSGRGIQTRDGRLLHCLVNLTSGMHVFGSDDHGNTWYLIDTPIEPADESKIIELVDGRWMINSRVNTDKHRVIHHSQDGGKSWMSTPDTSLIDPGCNASIIRYSSILDGQDKNRLLFANAKSKEGRKNMTVRISYDEGKTWSKGKTIYNGPSAYSSITILKNGDIGLLFEKDNYTSNVFVSFSLSWLTDFKD
jgi:sialidase-1